MKYINFLISFFTFLFLYFTGCSNPLWYALNDNKTSLKSTPEILITGPEDFDYTDAVNDVANKPSGSMRALALSPDKSLIYSAYMFATDRYLFAYDTSGNVVYSFNYYSASSPQPWAKAVAVHSSGRVYYVFADTDEIAVFDADLTNEIIVKSDQLAGIGTDPVRDLDPQGIEVYGNFLYVSSDQLNRIYRYNLSATGDILSHDSAWAGGQGFVQITDLAPELVQLKVNPGDGSIWCAAEDANQVYRISADGLTVTTPLAIPTNGPGFHAAPHDVDFIGNYILVSYAANDGLALAPRGIGVFSGSTFLNVTTLIDPGVNPELRDAQGLAVDEAKGIIYVVDGYFGTPNDLSLAPNTAPDIPGERDLILKLQYNF